MNMQQIQDRHGSELWQETPVVAVDLETTGLSPWADGITEVAVIVATIDESGRIDRQREFQSLCNPIDLITPRIQQLTGIGWHMVRHCDPFDLVWSDKVEPILPTGWPLFVAHNADFEAGFLANHAQSSRWHGAQWWLDTCILARAGDGNLNRYARGYKLAEVASRLGLDYHGDAHRAMPDADLCLRVLAALIKLHKWATPADALRVQRWWLDCAT